MIKGLNLNLSTPVREVLAKSFASPPAPTGLLAALEFAAAFPLIILKKAGNEKTETTEFYLTKETNKEIVIRLFQTAEMIYVFVRMEESNNYCVEVRWYGPTKNKERALLARLVVIFESDDPNPISASWTQKPTMTETAQS